ncbi:N-acetyltransferase [Paenibacillus sp. J31TS4]|uniref:GNAT family N-acetyltransferase n=1 Tax=Paenibacillus sp. J31TS4 TaxID=2807195 RepID=UPI001B27C0B5|nr:GNAT family N-acetyltransferase [Paenibacillus sp. J31TS4]GIP37377.1 N-acetyltransferase [Paenibacillus sp. J31TS4]
MRVVNATLDDLKGWLELASEVEFLFGPMGNDPKFIQAVEKNMKQGSAFCVRDNDGLPGSKLLGGLLFSSSNAPNYKIGWLSVSSQARNKGVATALVGHVLRRTPAPAEVTVITFGEDSPDGQPARKFYEKLGFLPLDERIPNGPEGGSRQKFKLVLS